MWVDEYVGGWMDEWISGWMDGQEDKWVDRWGQMHGITNDFCCVP